MIFKTFILRKHFSVFSRINVTKILIKEKFINEEERKFLNINNIEEHLTVLWCAKESLYKLYGTKQLDFKKNLLIEPFDFSGNGKITGRIKTESMNKLYTLHYEKINSDNNNYILVYVINRHG